MTKEMVWQISQLQICSNMSMKLVWMILSLLGLWNSSWLHRLWRSVKFDLEFWSRIQRSDWYSLCAAISPAIKLVENYCGNGCPAAAKLWNCSTNVTSLQIYPRCQQAAPTHSWQSLSWSQTRTIFVLISASNAIGIVLRENITEEPSLTELECLVKNKSWKDGWLKNSIKNI